MLMLRENAGTSIISGFVWMCCAMVDAAWCNVGEGKVAVWVRWVAGSECGIFISVIYSM